MDNKGFNGIVRGKLHSECDEDGCGVDFKLTGNSGREVEMERDEAVIVPDAFEDECFRDSFCKKPSKYTMTGTISQIASAINALGGGKNFDSGATIKKNGRSLAVPKKTGYNYKKPFYVDGGSVVINRTNMLSPKVHTFSGTTYEIASKINSYGGNGVKLVDSNGNKLKSGGSIAENNKNGDCYEVSGKIALKNKKELKGNSFIGTPYLVHAQVYGQGELTGIAYGHSFIEDDVYVYDFSNGNEFIVPKSLYYVFGKIKKTKPYYYKYSFGDARKKMAKTGHFGSWELKTETGL